MGFDVSGLLELDSIAEGIVVIGEVFLLVVETDLEPFGDRRGSAASNSRRRSPYSGIPEYFRMTVSATRSEPLETDRRCVHTKALHGLLSQMTQ